MKFLESLAKNASVGVHQFPKLSNLKFHNFYSVQAIDSKFSLHLSENVVSYWNKFGVAQQWLLSSQKDSLKERFQEAVTKPKSKNLIWSAPSSRASQNKSLC